MNRDPILGLAPRKLARILGLSVTSDQGDKDLSNMEVAELLDKCLHTGVSDKDNEMTTWTDLLENLKADQETSCGTAMIDILTSSKSSLKGIRTVRKCSKQRAARNGMDPEYSVAITLYFAAIANALLFHGTKITTYSYESLEVSLNRLVSKPWMPKELGMLMAKASDLCKSRR